MKTKRSIQSSKPNHWFKQLPKVLAISALAISMNLSSINEANAVEEIPYQVVEKQDNFELRKYSSYLLAETEVNSKFDEAGNRAFRRLFRFITGNNQSQIKEQEKGEKIAMTAPVIQQEKREKIAMTAPVIQQNGEKKNNYLVSFVMPQNYTLDTVPRPKNSAVNIRKVPAKLMAAIRYSGWWSKDNYQKHKNLLYKKIKTNGYQIVGKPLYARYNDPFTLWFLRRNEILVDVKQVKQAQTIPTEK